MAGLPQTTQLEVLATVDSIPQLRGLGVAHIGNGMCQVLREPVLPEGLRTWIILHEKVVQVSRSPRNRAPTPPPPSNKSLILKEALDAGLSCTSAVLAGTAVAVSAGAAPITGGTSLIVTTLATSATLASAAQCGFSTGRLINAVFAPENNVILDESKYVQATTQFLDAVALAGGIASLGQTAKALIRMSRSSSRPLSQLVRGMTRPERKRLAQEMARYAGQPATRSQFIKMARSGKIDKIIRQHNITQALMEQFLNQLSYVFTVLGSMNSGVIYDVVFADDGVAANY